MRTAFPELITELVKIATTTAQNHEQLFMGETPSAPESTSKHDESDNEVSLLRAQLQEAREAQQRAERVAKNCRSEYIALQAKHERLSTAHSVLQDQWHESKERTQTLTKSTAHLESKLLTSQFREREALVFLRQFRSFYIRLLQSKLTPNDVGGGRMEEIMTVNDAIKDLPGVDDFKDLMDVDHLMIQSGLIESDSDVKQQGIPASPNSSSSSEHALQRSLVEAKICEDKEWQSRPDVYILASPTSPSSSLIPPDIDTVEHRQRLASSPAGVLAAKRERVMDKQMVELSRKYSNLQAALKAEKAMVDALSCRQGALDKVKAVNEVNTIKAQLDRRTKDLQAAMWKLSELNMVIQNMNEKVEHRDQLLLDLEEQIHNLQGENERESFEKHREYRRLQSLHSKLKQQLDHSNIPLWQLGETQPPHFSTRLAIPVHGGMVVPLSKLAGGSKIKDKKKKKRSLEDIALGGLLLLEPPYERKEMQNSSSQTEVPLVPETAVVETQTEHLCVMEMAIQTEEIVPMVDSITQTESKRTNDGYVLATHQQSSVGVANLDLDNVTSISAMDSSLSMHTIDSTRKHEISTITDDSMSVRLSEVEMKREEDDGDEDGPVNHGRLCQSDPSLHGLPDGDSSWTFSASSWRQKDMHHSAHNSSSGRSSRTFSVQEEEDDYSSQRGSRRLHGLGSSSRSKLEPGGPSPLLGVKNRLGDSTTSLDTITSTTTSTTVTSVALGMVSPRRSKSTSGKPEWMQKLVAKQKQKEPEKPEWMKKLKASAAAPKAAVPPWSRDMLPHHKSRRRDSTGSSSTTTTATTSSSSRRPSEWCQTRPGRLANVAVDADEAVGVVLPAEWKQRFEQIGLKNQIEIVSEGSESGTTIEQPIDS